MGVCRKSCSTFSIRTCSKSLFLSEPSSVARWRDLTITVPGHIIILIIRAPIMLLCRPAITLRAMALRQVGTRSPTACNASGRTIRGAERTLEQTAVAIHALERCETVTCKLAMDGLIFWSNVQ